MDKTLRNIFHEIARTHVLSVWDNFPEVIIGHITHTSEKISQIAGILGKKLMINNPQNIFSNYNQYNEEDNN